MTLRILAFAVLAACMQQHEAGVIAVQPRDCSTCHTLDYNNTATPVHRDAGYPTTCGDCHRTTSWQPALDGLHPEPPAFPIVASPHSGMQCLECHDLDIAAPSTMGANTNCVGCHPNTAYQMESHVGAVGPLGQQYNYDAGDPNFCLVCHPKGLAKKHPNDRFPRTGPHATTCANCHDRSMGVDTLGQNTTCIRSGCHSLGQEDSEHREVGSRYQTARGDGSNKHFCLLCHPSGRR